MYHAGATRRCSVVSSGGAGKIVPGARRTPRRDRRALPNPERRVTWRFAATGCDRDEVVIDIHGMLSIGQIVSLLLTTADTATRHRGRIGILVEVVLHTAAP